MPTNPKITNHEYTQSYLENIKKILLNTQYIADNEALQDYLNLLKEASGYNHPGYVECHHIIPRSLSRLLQEPEAREHLINLTYGDHVCAHYYLYKCAQGPFRKSMQRAVQCMLNICKKADTSHYKISDLCRETFEQLTTYYDNLQLTLDAETFIGYYSTHSNTETARHFYISKSCVRNFAHKFKCFKNIRRHLNASVEMSLSAFTDYYLVQRHTIKETAEHFDVSGSYVRNYVKKHKLYKNKYRHAKRGDYNSSDIAPEIFIAYYKGHTIGETTIYFNISQTRVEELARRYNVRKVRNIANQDFTPLYLYYSAHGLEAACIHYDLSPRYFNRLLSKYLKSRKENAIYY